MSPKPNPSANTTLLLEQLALTFTSFVWTMVVLSPVIFFWAMQDIQANWEIILNGPQPQQDLLFSELETTPTPALEVWLPPTPTLAGLAADPVAFTTTEQINIPEPSLLPDTPGLSDSTPIPIIVHTQDEVAEALPQAVAVEPPSALPDNSAAVITQTLAQTQAVVLPLPTATPLTAEPPPVVDAGTETQISSPLPIDPNSAPPSAPTTASAARADPEIAASPHKLILPPL